MVGLAPFVDEASRGELGADLAQWLVFDALEASFPTLHLAMDSLAIARGLELLDEPSLLELREHAHDLSHGNPKLVVRLERKHLLRQDKNCVRKPTDSRLPMGDDALNACVLRWLRGPCGSAGR